MMASEKAATNTGKIKKKAAKKIPRKGALIKGMTKKLPSEILDNTVFRQGLRETMKGFSGIYALYKKDKLYYVGLTTNLFGRIKWHMKDRHSGKWDSFVIFRIKRIDYLRDIETLITHLVKLPGNKVKGKVPRDADINRILRRILQEHNKEIQGISKALKR